MASWNLAKGKRTRPFSPSDPWVVAGELESLSGVAGGDKVLLRDDLGRFVAWGYGNPESYIKFRGVSWRAERAQSMDQGFWEEQLVAAWLRRIENGFLQSYRICFSESDFLPGLIVDRYSDGQTQVLVLQILTAGCESALRDIAVFLQNVLSKMRSHGASLPIWEQTGVVIRRDSQRRKEEGLTLVAPQILLARGVTDFNNYPCVVGARGSEPGYQLSVDLLGGQKTGLFLDQTYNAQRVLEFLRAKQSLPRRLRVLDLCCYRGQWTVALATALKKLGCEVEAHLVDSSASALVAARQHAIAAGAQVHTYALDVMKEWPQEWQGRFDLVINDPPAFVKKKDDLQAGKAAYAKLNQKALKVLAPEALLVSCSCSGLMSQEGLEEAISRGLFREKKVGYILARGQAGQDHPAVLGFSASQYLKMVFLQIRDWP